MACVRYSAQRSLVAGVSVNDTIELAVATRDPFSRGREPRRSMHTSLDFTTETLYYAGRDVWPITSIPLEGDDRDEFVQFLDSVEDGQVFEFSPYEDNPATAVDWRNVVCASNGYEETEEVATGSQTTSLYSYTFTLAEVP